MECPDLSRSGVRDVIYHVKGMHMKGTRPLDNNDIRLVLACFTGTCEVHNRCLFTPNVNSDQRDTSMILVVSRHNSIYNS